LSCEFRGFARFGGSLAGVWAVLMAKCVEIEVRVRPTASFRAD